MSREAFDPSQWDPRYGSKSELVKRYGILNNRVASMNSWLATNVTRAKLLTPRDVVYADLQVPFKNPPDPANHGTFRFVWLEDSQTWVPMHSVWFYNGPRERFYPFW